MILRKKWHVFEARTADLKAYEHVNLDKSFDYEHNSKSSILDSLSNVVGSEDIQKLTNFVKIENGNILHGWK